MKLFSKTKLFALAIISAFSINLNGAAAGQAAAAAEVKQADENRSLLDKLDIAYAQAHYYKGKLLSTGMFGDIDEGDYKQIRENIHKFRVALQDALAYRLPQNADTVQATKYQDLQDYLNVVKDPTKTPLYQDLVNAIQACRSAGAKDIRDLLAENGITVADLIQHIDKPIRADVKNTLLWMASIRNCANLVEILLFLGSSPHYRIPANVATWGGQSVIDMVRNHDEQTRNVQPIFEKFGFNIRQQQQQQARPQ